MKKTLILAAASAVVLAHFPALAQTPPAAPAAAAPARMSTVPPAFVVIVDMERMLRECTACKNRDTQLQSWANGVRTKDETDLKALNAEGENLQRSRATMAPEAWESQAKAFEDKYNARLNEARNRTQELQIRSAVANNAIINAADPIIAEVMGQKGANIALEMSSTRSFFNGLDVTADVLTRLNAKITTVSIEPPKPQTPAAGARPATPPPPPPPAPRR